MVFESGVNALLGLPIDEVIGLMLQACDALAEAHALGIVHRDLKPPNIFVTRRSNGAVRVKVLDFGISKMTETVAGTPGLTSTKAFVGTPVYTSPEQLREARNVDGRADIWALGVTM
jgi:serine/threonine-protein kinase